MTVLFHADFSAVLQPPGLPSGVGFRGPNGGARTMAPRPFPIPDLRPLMQVALAPMEGLIDDVLRELLTGLGGIDWCVSEFVRVNEQRLPAHVFLKLAPELAQGARTRSGTPMHLQLLGSDPASLADNAAYACTLGAPVIDLNFGCPAKTVNRSRGGAVLLNEPELLHAILRAVRAAVPAAIPVTAKMRLGYERPEGAIECAQALVDGGAARLVVHARTKTDGYRPPAYWEWIARIKDAVKVPVIANGEIWTLEDWQRCRAISGVEDVMIGRGMIARPDLARQIAALRAGTPVEPMQWPELLGLLRRFWALQRAKPYSPRYAPGRLKQWLHWLAPVHPQVLPLHLAVRREEDAARIDALIDAA